jgi:hypothetical protein
LITNPSRVPLGRRAWIGDGRHGASVAADGTVDWYCSAGLGADPDLWRMLDPQGAAVRVGPSSGGAAAAMRLPASVQSYRDRTNVLETVIEGVAGIRVAVTDFMPWPGPGLDVPGSIVRLVRALSGPVEIEVEVLPGPRRHFGGQAREVAAAGGRLVLGAVEVRAEGRFMADPLERDVERWRAVVPLDSGQETVVTVGRVGEAAELGVDGARRLLAETEAAWRSWLVPLYYAGPYRAAAERAALSVRALTAGGSGGASAAAPRAAGTSSLPRRVGSERSSDDRWVRVRDAATAAATLARFGLAEDAEAAEGWLRHALTEADRPWPGWLDPDGQPVDEPREWPFSGWRRSQPVISGRAPVGPDAGLAGAVVVAVGASTRGPGGRPGDPGQLSAASPALAAAVDWVADRWRHPDTGRWEIERPRRLYVAGRVEAWAALDGMARLARAANPLDLEAVGWQAESRSVLAWLEAEGVAPDGGLRMDPTSDEADAALLAVAWSGPWAAVGPDGVAEESRLADRGPAHPVVTATVDRVLERLSSGLLLYRYSDRVADERAGPDNPDLEASLMAVRALAALGRWEESHERMEAVAALGGSLRAPLTETADPVSGELFGNFPATAVALAILEGAKALEPGPR